jgi:hypothetical protein
MDEVTRLSFNRYLEKTMDTHSNSSLTHTWKEQIHQIAARNPRLAHQLWQNRQVYFARFAQFYRQLANLPRKFRRKFLRGLATTLAGAALLLALGQALPARAATITVDGVTCTLAEAIDSANNDNAAGNGCVDGSGADVLDLQTDVLLSAALPSITSEITLVGNGHTLDGNDAFQVLNVQATGNLTLNNATITGGFSGGGGGIFNSGTLTVTNSTLNGNSSVSVGGAIFNLYTGTVTINNSTISDNIANLSGGHGGGITNSGIMIVANSTLSGNSAGSQGGGIQLNPYPQYPCTLEVSNSTITGNLAYDGGGIANNCTLTVNNSTINDNSAARGGGINNGFFGTVVINNSTLSGNSTPCRICSGGGIANFGGTVTLNNSALTGNSATADGGGIWDWVGSVILNRSLISGNSATNGAEVRNVSGAVSANSYNVIGYGGDARSSGFTPGPNDIIPPGALDTVLDTALADNGGPTLTHALVSGSVAIDAAPDVSCLAPPINGIDQRGYARNVDGDGNPSSNECDSGAFEFVPDNLPTFTPTPTATTRPTRTPTPRPTRTPTPTLIAVQESALLPPTQEQAANPFFNWIAVVVLALGNMLFFRKGRS